MPSLDYHLFVRGASALPNRQYSSYARAKYSNKQTLVCERQNHYEIQIRRASNGKKLGRIYTGNYNQFVAVTRDDRWIITRDSGIDIWNLKNGKLYKSIKVAPKQINEAKISANGRYLIVTYRATTLDESIEIWPISKLI